MTPKPGEALRSARAGALPVVGLFVVLWLVDIGKDAIVIARGGMPPESGLLLATGLWWLPWIAFAPGIAWLADRLDPERWGWPRALALTGLAGLTAVPVHIFVSALASRWIAGDPSWIGLTTTFSVFIDRFFLLDLLVWWGAMGGSFAISYHRRFRERAFEALRLQARTSELERLMTEARLRALETELNPHFLFNALNSVSGLVRRGESEAAVQMLARLGELLRTTLSLGDHEVTLRDELAVLECYLDVERVRFRDRLRVDADIEESACDALVPTLVLQPLVENAIKHGLLGADGEVLVAIRGWTAEGRLQLAVTNTGSGLNGAAPREGTGLANTRARLMALYGAEATVDVVDRPGGGVEARVRLPHRTKEMIS